MIDACRELYRHFNNDYVFEVNGIVEIAETSKSGAGIARFKTDGASIVLKVHNQPPLLWSLKIRCCSDGAFITFDDQGAHLHLVELKSGLDAREWAHAVEQFRGMYLTAIAALRLLNIQEIVSVKCYIAYKKIRYAASDETNPVLLKALVGGQKTIGGLEELFKNLISLPLNVSARLKHAVRDSSGDADFGAVA